MHQALRVHDGHDLGRAGRSVDLALGVLGVLPMVMLAGAALVWPSFRPLIRTLDVAWTGALLAFLSGVRRGLTFSEAGGGRAGELVTMLTVFFAGVLTLLLQSLWIGAVGIAAVGVLDAMAARRLETPDYFAVLRPLQMVVGAAALVLAAVALG